MGITKLADMSYHPPEQGRLRFGEKDSRNLPKASDRWILSSPDKDAIHQAAEIYGGTPEPWNERSLAIKNQWKVKTETNVLDCWIDGSSYDQIREEWAGGLCVRRCDGETCDLTMKSGTLRGQPCQCAAEGKDDSNACKWKTRVSVILPRLRFGGLWRLESSSEHFAREAPGMIDTFVKLQERGFSSCEVRLTQRTKVTAQGTRHFIVPQFGLPATPVQLVSGAAAIGSGSTPPPVAELARPATPVDDFPGMFGAEVVALLDEEEDDDDIEDAVVVEPEGWDTDEEMREAAKSGVKVVRNFSGSGPKWVRK